MFVMLVCHWILFHHCVSPNYLFIHALYITWCWLCNLCVLTLPLFYFLVLYSIIYLCIMSIQDILNRLSCWSPVSSPTPPSLESLKFNNDLPVQYSKLRMRTPGSSASNWRMRTYKSPVPATAAVAQVSQSSQQSSTQLSIFSFLKFATLSFAIPPPISASARSRQAGTETEREASAMEALGPGKEFKKGENQRGERAVCGARVRKCVASLGAAAAARPRRADGKTNRGPARVSVYMFTWLHLHPAEATFCDCTSGVSVFIGYTVRPRGFIYLKHAQARRVGAGIVWVGI